MVWNMVTAHCNSPWIPYTKSNGKPKPKCALHIFCINFLFQLVKHCFSIKPNFMKCLIPLSRCLFCPSLFINKNPNPSLPVSTKKAGKCALQREKKRETCCGLQKLYETVPLRHIPSKDFLIIQWMKHIK